MAINVTVTEEIVNVNVSVSTLANDIAAANALRAEQAANAAEGFKDDAEAAAIQTNADAIATAADRVQTGLDVIATNADVLQTGADRIQTGLDAVATSADRIQTGLDVIATNADAIATAADRVQTDLDAAATAADRIQTGLDATATAADRVQTGLDAIATAADRVQTGLDVIATNADVVTVTNFSNLILASQNTAIIQDLGSIDGTVDIDLLDGTLVIADLTDAVVFTFSGLPDNDKETAFTLRLSGLEQITFPVGTKFANGEVPTPEGALYEIPCSIDSTGALIVYGVINDIKVP
jgi:uncharacterized phage infection (PIP) family protein YhgE